MRTLIPSRSRTACSKRHALLEARDAIESEGPTARRGRELEHRPHRRLDTDEIGPPRFENAGHGMAHAVDGDRLADGCSRGAEGARCPGMRHEDRGVRTRCIIGGFEQPSVGGSDAQRTEKPRGGAPGEDDLGTAGSRN